jgi:hypothetical protein
MTTTHELAKMLLELPDIELMIQTDDEGNGYRPLNGVDGNCVWFNNNIFDRGWTAEDADMDEEEWEEIKLNNPYVAVIY